MKTSCANIMQYHRKGFLTALTNTDKEERRRMGMRSLSAQLKSLTMNVKQLA